MVRAACEAERKIPNFQKHQCVPYLEWYIPANLTTKAIQIIYSGGGYGVNDPDGFAAMNSVKAWEQMRRLGIASDLHTLCLRPHGFQQQASLGTGSYTWLGRIWEFMSGKGINR